MLKNNIRTLILRLLRHSPKIIGYNKFGCELDKVKGFRNLGLGGQTFDTFQFCNH